MFPAKKENNYVFLTTSEFKFLDIKNYIGPGLSLMLGASPVSYEDFFQQP